MPLATVCDYGLMVFAAVLLDVDGVLLDSTAAHRRVWTAWAANHRLDVEFVWKSTFGRRPEDTIRDVAPHLDPAVERIALDGLLVSERGSFPPLPGASDLLARLYGRPWAIVTSGSRETTQERFHAAALPLPEVQIYGEDVDQAKPAPDCYLLAAERLGVLPTECAVIEDAPAGVEAAVVAGCTVIGLSTTHAATALDRAHLHAATLKQALILLEQL
ncbi:HAD-IA family hydrolase [Streptomyces sp. CNS654]|uniref:HAD-IA family hydrolase n=1 Tax=Streptomyces sp. CNS654 TaxID=1506995 RepID=UPI001F158BD1|nr:HAD-IA family hydrolase [Streptomyces sp. CNS654]